MMKSISCILLVCLFGRIAYAEETQEQQVERLIKELQDTDPEVRGSAADALGSIGEGAKDAVPALIQLLQDSDEGVRINAAIALVQISMMGAPDAIKAAKDAMPILIQALRDPDEVVCMNTVYALGSIGSEDAVLALVQALQDKDANVRMNVSQALGHMGGSAEGMVPALVQALQDKDANVRGNAAMALGQISMIGIPEAIEAAMPVLIQLLQDEHTIVRVNAAEALVKIGTPEAIKAAEDAVPDLMPVVGLGYGDNIEILIGDSESVYLLASYSPDGEKVVTTGFNGVSIWNSKTGEKIDDLINTSMDNYGPDYKAIYSPNGNQIVTFPGIDGFGYAMVWDSQTGE